MVEIDIVSTSATHKNVTAAAQGMGAIARNGLAADQPVMWNVGGNYFYQYRDPTDADSVVEFHDAELEAKVREDEKKKKNDPPPPTAANPHPPELIPDDGTAIAVCLSPDVCKSPDRAIPYIVWGKGDDKNNYSPNVRSNGKVIKRRDSTFSKSYGDEPGTGKGVKSGTVGDVVEPVTSSAIVRANGIPVQRHTDRCTLNNGNCPGEYVNVKSTAVHPAPDGNDAQNRSELKKLWDGFYDNSDEAKLAGGVLHKGEEYWNDPSKIGSDIGAAWDARPSVDDVVDFGKSVGHGVANTADYVWNNPVQSAKNVGGWTADAVKGVWTGVTDAYDKGGVAQAGGHLAATALGVVNPFKKVKAATETVEVLEKAGDIAKAEHRIKEAEEAAKDAKKLEDASKAKNAAEQTPEDATRSSRLIPLKEVECFNKPSGVSEKEFLRQLKEQEDALNETTAETLLARRKAIRDAGGTTPLRDLKAQADARLKYSNDRFDELRTAGKTRTEAKAIIESELSNLAATHRLDIIAGGDPSDISGMGDKSVNSSFGSQWRGRRSQSLEDYASDLKKRGAGKEKMNVKLRMC